ncbi:MAG: permease prefix domain 1-containing protein [Opitutaceae bacterium]
MNVFRKIHALFRKEKLDAEMSEEMRLHLERRTEENVANGMSPEEARYAALRKFGGVEQAREIARGQRSWVWCEQTAQDLRYALRALRKSPSFTLTAVDTLALGIGVNAALFIAYNAVALRALPVHEPETLVALPGGLSRGGAFLLNFSYPEYLDYRDGNRVLSGLAAVSEAQRFLNEAAHVSADPLFTGREPGTVAVQFVSDNYFGVLGTKMKLGRAFLPEENRAPGAAAVVVLSHLFWDKHFRRDPHVLGRTVSLAGTVYTVIGVAREEFTWPPPRAAGDVGSAHDVGEAGELRKSRHRRLSAHRSFAARCD